LAATLKAGNRRDAAARLKRYLEALGLPLADATLLAGICDGQLLTGAVAAGGDAKRVANLILSHGRRIANERALPLGRLNPQPPRLAELAG